MSDQDPAALECLLLQSLPGLIPLAFHLSVPSGALLCLWTTPGESSLNTELTVGAMLQCVRSVAPCGTLAPQPKTELLSPASEGRFWMTSKIPASEC